MRYGVVLGIEMPVFTQDENGYSGKVVEFSGSCFSGLEKFWGGGAAWDSSSGLLRIGQGLSPRSMSTRFFCATLVK